MGLLVNDSDVISGAESEKLKKKKKKKKAREHTLGVAKTHAGDDRPPLGLA